MVSVIPRKEAGEYFLNLIGPKRSEIRCITVPRPVVFPPKTGG